MAVKKPKAKKSGFDIGDILKFVENQAIGPKAQGLWKEAANIPVPGVSDMSAGSGQWLGGISPTTLALGAKAGKGLEGLANTGIGQWYGLDSLYNLGKSNQSSSDNLKNIAASIFSVAPLGAGGAVGKSGKALKSHLKDGLVSSGATKDILSVIRMLMGMQSK